MHRPAARQQERAGEAATERQPAQAAEESTGDDDVHATNRAARGNLAPLTCCDRMSILRDEIAEQPAVLERLLADSADLGIATPRFALIVARGSSDNVARYAQHVLGRHCGVPVALATPSLYTLYDAPPRLDGALVIGISQSGASPDVTAVVQDAADQGQATVAITNDPDSPMARAAQHVVALGTGEERSVAATKTYTASLAAVAALAADLAGDAELHDELRAVPAAVAAQLDEPVEEAVEVAATWQRCAVVGRGANYATAFEAALKVKELTGIAAEPYSPPDLMHGPVAVVGPEHGVLAFAPPGPTEADVRAAVHEAERRGAPAILASHDEDSPVRLVPQPDWLSPFCAAVAAQRLAAGLAERRGIEVDRPFGLSKITRTT